MGVFKVKNGFSCKEQPIQFMEGTNAEAFVLGEILKLSSGLLTKADPTSAGTQQYVCLAAVTGATGIKNVPVSQLREDLQFECTSTATVAASLIGSAVTLSTAATECTATTTNGVFVIDKTDGVTTNSTVLGHFTSAAAV
jgi:hypothetical protein